MMEPALAVVFQRGRRGERLAADCTRPYVDGVWPTALRHAGLTFALTPSFRRLPESEIADPVFARVLLA